MIRLLWRVSALLALLVTGLVIAFSIYRLLSARSQEWVRQRWSRALLWVCGVTVKLNGLVPASRAMPPSLVALNHVSWLDVFALNAVMPVTFVAKSEIRRWPLVGWLVAGTGTIFIERGNRHAVRHVNQEIRRRLVAGEHIAFFPEGTTSDGDNVLRFHTSLFAVALHEDETLAISVPIQPIAIRYFQHGQRSTIPAYTGDDTLVGSIRKILMHRGLQVELYGLETIPSVSPLMTRHALAATVEEDIREIVLRR